VTGLEVRPLAPDDLDRLDAYLRPAPYRSHADDLAAQERGEVTVLVAWIGGRPIGQGLIRWEGPRDATVASALPGCPEIFRLSVEVAHQSRGAGTALLDAMEALARARGLPAVGLGVGLENPRARRLYERRGYRDAGCGTYTDTWFHPDASRRRVRVDDACEFLVKPLR
jgi:GNAT superfamily N-acetyltransferase